MRARKLKKMIIEAHGEDEDYEYDHDRIDSLFGHFLTSESFN